MTNKHKSSDLSEAHFLVTRTDRLGDMVLTLPLFAAIKRAYPQARLSVLASPANVDVARMDPLVDQVLIDPVEARDSKYKDTFGLAARMRAWRPDVVLFGNAKHRLALAAWLARVPRRIGSIRRRYSVFYTDRVPILVDQPNEHEADRALRLLRPMGIEPVTNTPTLHVSSDASAQAASILRQQKLATGAKLAVVHPCNSGNALNASPNWYAELADALSTKGFHVVLTGTAAEQSQTDAVCKTAQSAPTNLTGKLSVAQLAGLYACSAVCIASSTGTAHLSAAVSTPTIGLYAPLVKQAQWLPRGEQVIVLRPQVGMTCKRCLGPRCDYFNCMEHVSVQAVVAAAQQLTSQRA